MAASPRKVLTVVMCAAVATGVGGWVIGSQVQSPADAAAARQAPTPSLVTAPVERKALTNTVITQGTVAYGTPTPLVLSGTVGGASTTGEGAQLITKAPTAGGTLSSGDVLLEISGRPVFVLPGTVPMYRTLQPGSKGDDVKQLQAALVALGHASGLRSGVFDAATAIAVGKLYTRAGYEAQKPSDAQRRQLRALEQAVSEATDALTVVPEGGDSRRQRQNLDAARQDLTAFRSTYGTSVPSGEILFLPKLPGRLDVVTAKAGATATGAIGTVTDPTVLVQGAVPTVDGQLLRTGLAATLQAPDGTEIPATLEAVGKDAAPPTPATPTTGTPAPQQVSTSTPFRVAPREQGALAPFAGQAVKVTFRVGATEGDVLVVPVAAVVTGGDGQARVRVNTTGTQVREVPVRLGLTAYGEVQVTPTGAATGTLAAGDRVVVTG